VAVVKLKGNDFSTIGDLPATGTPAPAFTLTGVNLADITSDSLKGKKVVLNIFPSVDTGTCASSVRKFNSEAAALENTTVVCVSRDLPFAQNRFCGAEGLENVVSASDFRTGDFGRSFGVQIQDGPLAGLLSRAIVVLNEEGHVVYTQQVAETVDEPDYAAALAAAK